MRAEANQVPRARHPSTHGFALLAACAAALAAPGSPALAQSFTLVGTLPPTYNSSQNTGISADGRVVTGYLQPRAGYTWTAAGGRVDFGVGMNNTQPKGISGDGQVVVGAAGALGEIAFRWSQATGYQSITRLPGFSAAECTDANFDGSIIVGTLSNGPGSTPQAFRWTQATGMVGLGLDTRAEQISGDGSTIVGTLTNQPLAMKWTQTGGVQVLPPLGGAGDSHARAVNFDGSLIVGNSGSAFRATMWIQGSPVELLSTIPNSFMTPFGMDDQGEVVAGIVQDGSGNLFPGVWTPETLTVRLDDYLAANGVIIPAGVSLQSCTAVSADGRTFVGRVSGSQGGQGYVATIATPCAADVDNDGLFANGGHPDQAITIEDLLFFLYAFEFGSPAADLDNGTGTGVHDGAVTIDDLLFFLARFEAGC